MLISTKLYQMGGPTTVRGTSRQPLQELSRFPSRIILRYM